MRLQSHIYQLSDWLEIFLHSCGARQRMILLSDARTVQLIFFLINAGIKYCLPPPCPISFPCSLVIYGLQWQWQNLIQIKKMLIGFFKVCIDYHTAFTEQTSKNPVCTTRFVLCHGKSVRKYGQVKRAMSWICTAAKEIKTWNSSFKMPETH